MTDDALSDPAIELAADALAAADALLISAGAGMGVDSGLPDFRGDQGFWNAYPPYQKLGLSFHALATPRWFVDDPALAWGFYGHRLELYRRTTPHDGFRVLARLGAHAQRGAFVFTSNVDGQFQRAGFAEDAMCEVHGSIHHLQCTASDHGLWPAEGVHIDVDTATFRAVGALPRCPKCGALARPNVLMFGDWGFDDRRSGAQGERLERWLQGARHDSLVVVELGAGTGVPTVRNFSERLVRRGARLVRINLREPEVPAGQISIARGARDAMLALAARLDVAVSPRR